MVTELLSWTGLEYLFSPNKRIYWGFLLWALLIALMVSKLSGQSRQDWLSADIWWQPSARLDYRYFVVNSAVKIALLAPLLISAGDLAMALVQWLDQTLGYRDKLAPVATATLIAYSCTLFICNDLTRYWLHRAMHRYDWLWAIHRVHHSAEVLTPITFYRVHPFENLLFGLRYAVTAGTITGLFIYGFGAAIQSWQIAGVNGFVLMAHLAGDNLRHSHLGFGYPRWLENWLISPSQHQYHHTETGARCNFGGVLAVWDRCFGSLRYSVRGEVLEFGLGEKAPSGVLDLLMQPLQRWALPLRPAVSLMLIAIVITLPVNSLASDLKAELGRALFFDTSLSLERNLSCSSCHNPERGFVETRDSGVGAAASQGDDGHSLGDRNTPGLTYAALTPAFHFDEKDQQYIGGMFWDGRARDLKQQAGQPILNPIEMAMPDEAAVIERVKANPYYVDGLRKAFGDDIFEDDTSAFDAVTEAIAAFENTEFFSPFDSKYDRYLRGEYELTDLEDLGMSIFFSTTNSNCTNCHQLKIMDDEEEPFTSFEYHNIGTPVNRVLRAANGVADDHVDAGLGGGGADGEDRHRGKFKVPSLRNVAVTGPYMHNGVFRDLRTVVEFYDQYNNAERSINPETGKPWQNPEVEDTINLEELKSKKLSDRKIDALIAFLATLTDRRYEKWLEN